MTGAGRGFCAGADMKDTFKMRLDGTDPGGDTEESGGMPPDVDWVALARESKPCSQRLLCSSSWSRRSTT